MLQDLDINVKLRINRSPFSKSLNEYDQRRLLGTGGFSHVYEAVCKNTDSTVALKIIEKNVIRKQINLRDRVLQEINIQCLLNHPSILKLYTAFEDENHVCIVLEFCSKGDLANVVKKGVSKKDVKGMMKQIVDGLHYLHSQNIVHRDLKLANILLKEDQRIKIADFGLATRITYPGEPHMTMCGTPNYISPEIVSQQVHGLEADLWSLGCVFYTLLVGKPPFETDSPYNTMNRVTSGRYEMPRYLPEAAQDLIKRLLQKIPDCRITLEEIRNHPFLSESLISADSGVDTYFGSSHHLSSKIHSIDSKQTCSNYSNGYVSFETPKSSRRCKSQDRQRYKEPTRIPLCDMNPIYADTMFPSDIKHRKVELESHQSHHSLRTGNHLTKGTSDFSPGGRHWMGHSNEYVEGRCEIFCENEILKHKFCDCYKCKRKMERDVEDPTSPPRAAIQKKLVTPTHLRGDNVSDSDGVEERVKVIPLNTERLNPTRAELKNAVLSILKNGDVCVERLKFNKGKKLVVEVVRICGDGSKMEIYYPNKGRGIPLEDNPPPISLNGPDAVFNCNTLSKENWKKYQKAAQYVEMVKSKTPKLTLYTNKAKCLLMENTPEPDFQVIYYDDTKKITKSRKGIVLVNYGKEYMLSADSWLDNLVDSNISEYYKYFQECYRRCCFLEAQLNSFSTPNMGEEFKLFPAILGKQPPHRSNEAVWDSCIESPNIFHSTKYPT